MEPYVFKRARPSAGLPPVCRPSISFAHICLHIIGVYSDGEGGASLDAGDRLRGPGARLRSPMYVKQRALEGNNGEAVSRTEIVEVVYPSSALFAVLAHSLSAAQTFSRT